MERNPLRENKMLPQDQYTCKHGVVFKKDDDYCDRCDAAEEAELQAGCNDDEICKHGVYESNCHECGAETDRLIEQANAQRDFNHWHPAAPESELCKHLRDPRDCDDCAEEQTCHHGVRVDQIECEDCMEEECGDIPGTGEDEEDE